jgi:myo-inositol 2-dehydrogenase / D-chiro-inositol 1-dehydrogenase
MTTPKQSTPDVPRRITRRGFVKGTAAAAATFTIVPPHVLGAPNHVAPSDTFNGALIGVGGRGPGTFSGMAGMFGKGPDGTPNVKKVAECDVKWLNQADNKTRYSDFRRLLERKDIDLIAIATPPHWHALITIAAMEAGKDVLCEKPMTRTIVEGRAVVEASRRYARVFQVGTFGRFGASGNRGNIDTHKIMRSGLLNPNPGVYVKRGGFKVKEWSGRPKVAPKDPPSNLDWDLYCGPSQYKPYQQPRHGGTHRDYWDYESGGMCDMGQHYMDPVNWIFGKDDTSPVEINASGAPQHPECTGMWAWVEMIFADGFTLVFESGEWGEPYTRKQPHNVSMNDLTPLQQTQIKLVPDPPTLLNFAEAVKTRGQAGGNAEAAHRTVCLLHLANIAIRMGRSIKYDPVREQIVGDEYANRMVHQPLRAPWHV